MCANDPSRHCSVRSRAVGLRQQLSQRKIGSDGSVSKGLGLIAIYALALHAVLLGVAPVIGGSSIAVDPFSIICRSDGRADRADHPESELAPINCPGTPASIAICAAPRLRRPRRTFSLASSCHCVSRTFYARHCPRRA